jgi:hypothetical protein
MHGTSSVLAASVQNKKIFLDFIFKEDLLCWNKRFSLKSYAKQTLP